MFTDAGGSADGSRKGYVVATIQIDDHEKFDEEYTPPTVDSIREYDGEVLVATDSPHVFEGEWPYNWTVVIEFPSVEAATAWYESDDYQAVIQARLDATEYGDLVLAEGTGN